MEFLMTASSLSVDKAFNLGTGIRKMALANKKRAFTAMTNLIKDMVLSFNIGKGINPTSQAGYTQMLEIAMLITEEFPGLRFEELVLVFKNAKKGRYGKVYDSMDVLTIMQWIREYENNERAEYLIKRNSAHKVNARKVETVDTRKLTQEEAKVAKENLKKLNEQMYSTFRKVDAERTEKEKTEKKRGKEFQNFNAEYWMRKEK